MDLSAGGALVDSPVALRPDSVLTLDIEGEGSTRASSSALSAVRSAPCGLDNDLSGACEFTTSIELPAELAGTARVLYPNHFVGVNVALNTRRARRDGERIRIARCRRGQAFADITSRPCAEHATRSHWPFAGGSPGSRAAGPRPIHRDQRRHQAD